MPRENTYQSSKAQQMLQFTYNAQPHVFYGHACIRRYTSLLLNQTNGACSGPEYAFLAALIGCHPNAHLLCREMKEIRVQESKLYVVNNEGLTTLVSLTHCYAGKNVNSLLDAMRTAVMDEEEAGAVTTKVDPICCAFIERKYDEEEEEALGSYLDLPCQFETNKDGVTCFKFGEDQRFVSQWRAYYDQEMTKTTTVVPDVKECPSEWLNARGWCVGRRNKNASYSRTVDRKTLVVCKHQQKWVFIYNGNRMDALAKDSAKEAMKAAYQYCSK